MGTYDTAIHKATITITVDTEFDGFENFCAFAERINEYLYRQMKHDTHAGVEVTDFTILLGASSKVVPA